MLLASDWSVRFLNAPPAWVVVLFIVPAVIAAVTILYKREPIAAYPRLRILLGTLRTIAVLALILILFRPVVQRTEMEERKPKLVVLVDDSASMTVRDAYVDETKRDALARAAGLPPDGSVPDVSRLDLVKGVWNSERTRLRDRLAEKCDLTIFSFGSEITRLSPDTDLSELHGSGAATEFGEAIFRSLGVLKAQNVAGIVALTDGRSNEGRTPLEAVAWLGEQQVATPVFTVGVGDPDSPRDIVLDAVTANATVLANDEVVFEATVRAVGFEGQVVALTLSEDGQTLASASLVLGGDDAKKRHLLYHRPTLPGLHRYTVTVAPQRRDEEESRQDNNSKVVTINVINRKINVLFVEGYPRWEYRYLTHALIRDEESVSAKVLLLSADPNFVQESSPNVEPLARFPSGKELFDFDVVIFGDVDPELLGATPEEASERLQEVEQLVDELGGGFAMIAGESDSPRRYRSTPLEKILPVVIESDEENLRYDPAAGEEFLPRLTDAGRGDPIMLLEKDPDENLRLFEDETSGLMPFQWFYPVKKEKTAARVLATHPSLRGGGGSYPIFVTGFYGTGRTFFSAVDSTWRWRYLVGNQYFYRFWSQVIRYLATNRLHTLNRRFELYCDKSEYDIGEKVTMTAKVRDQDFRPSESETQTVQVRPPGSLKPNPVDLARVQGKTGTFTKSFTATQTGSWEAYIEDASMPGEDREQTISFEVVIPSIEKDNAILDKATLETVAQRTGGAFVPLHAVADLPAMIRAEPDRIAKDTENRELWDDPLWLVLIAALLGLEWILRKAVRLL